MEYQNITLTHEGGVALLCLNRPEALNAMDRRMKEELIDALRKTETDDAVRVLILTGKGRGFCVGADRSRMIEAHKSLAHQGPKTDFGSLGLPRSFVHYPKRMIAAINGLAYGFGFTVTLTWDIRIASDKAEFRCGFVQMGVTPEFCSSYFLPRLIRYNKAAELVFTARPFGAKEALEIGVVDHLVAHEQLMTKAKQIANQIASMPPTAVRRAKQMLRHGMHSTPDQVMQYELMVFLDCMGSEEHQAIFRELMNKKKPKTD